MIKTVVGIEGMMCGMCEAHVNDAIRRGLNVKKVSASHKKNEAEIISEEAISPEEIKKVLATTGYTVTSINSEEYTKKGFFSK